MKHTIKLPGNAALTASPTIHEGGPAVFIDLKKFGMSLAQFHMPAHEGLAMADVLAEVSAEAEALMRGAGQAAGARIPERCTRVMPNGKPCGLTPGCPDCGRSLIDVAEGG